MKPNWIERKSGDTIFSIYFHFLAAFQDQIGIWAKHNTQENRKVSYWVNSYPLIVNGRLKPLNMFKYKGKEKKNEVTEMGGEKKKELPKSNYIMERETVNKR